MNSARLVQILSELVMLVLGLLLVLLALSGRFVVPRGLALWVILGALLMIWGLRTWVRRRHAAKPSGRAMQLVRSGSMVLAGAAMIAMVWLPAGSARWMLTIVGAILAARGLAGAALIAGNIVR